MTSGPTDPSNMGRSMGGVPSLKLRVASFSAMVVSSHSNSCGAGHYRLSASQFRRSDGPQELHYAAIPGIGRLAAPQRPVQQVGVGKIEQLIEESPLSGIESVQPPLDKALEDQVQLEQAA